MWHFVVRGKLPPSCYDCSIYATGGLLNRAVGIIPPAASSSRWSATPPALTGWDWRGSPSTLPPGAGVNGGQDRFDLGGRGLGDLVQDEHGPGDQRAMFEVDA